MPTDIATLRDEIRVQRRTAAEYETLYKAGGRRLYETGLTVAQVARAIICAYPSERYELYPLREAMRRRLMRDGLITTTNRER